jgi:RNA-directed DNA polymerase
MLLLGPQGGIVSPLAANIYLDQLDKYMESKYLHLIKGARARRRKQGKGNYLYARYADDFVVLCNGTKAEAQSMKEELHHVLKGMGLTLSEEKTKITHITEGFQFLGYRIERSRGETGKMVPKVLIPASAVTRFRHKVREMLAPSTSQESLSAKMHALNSLIRGWCNYYRCTSSPSKIFGKLSHEIYWDMVHWLGRKYQVNTPTVLRRYLKGHNTFGTATKTLVMPRDIKAKKRLVRTWHNPYTGIERIEREHLFSYTTLWTGDEHDRPGAMDLREEMMLLKGTRCAIQGPDCTSHGKPLHPSEVGMDHIIPRAKFKDPTEADRMGNLQPTCTPCHRAKTQTDSQVLRRMR